LTGDTPREEHDIWVVERQAGGRWGAPRNLGAPVNRDGATEWSPSAARNGNLYFGTIRDEGKGGDDLYVARWTGDRYAEPENLGDSVNTKAGEFEPWIAPDESYLIFSARGRPEGAGGFDLYVSERRNGIWRRARPLERVNSPKGDFNHSVSPDGQYLFFSTTRGRFDSMPPAPLPYTEMQRRLTGIGNGLGDIYRIPFSELEIRVGD
jgi:hypothetical protein